MALLDYVTEPCFFFSLLPMSNIWIAAGDGDLARVEELVLAGTLPNTPDEFTYTPMHAAASYGHIHVLEFLLAHGGDVNITDDDGDTPLYVVEDVVTARWLVDHGAVIDRTNNEGVSVRLSAFSTLFAATKLLF